MEYNVKTLSAQFQLKGDSPVQLVNSVSGELKDIIDIITRGDIIDAAKDKGLYIDLNNLTEKEKNNKNFKPDPTKTELNSDIMAAAFLSLMEDKEMAVKKGKKDAMDSKAKATKADPKAKGKKEESTIV